MSSDRDTTRIVRSWLEDGATRLPDRVLDSVLDQLPATHQRRATWWPVRRIAHMNTAARFGLAAAVVVVAALLGFNYLVGPNIGAPGIDDSSPSPAPLARGNFTSHGGQIELNATGEGSNVTGTMTYADVGGAALGGFVVDLACTRTTDGGLILIGGPITESTSGYVESAPEGTNVALILQPGSPVNAEIYVEHPDPHEPSCPTFLESLPDERPLGALEPIEGTIELRP